MSRPLRSILRRSFFYGAVALACFLTVFVHAADPAPSPPEPSAGVSTNAVSAGMEQAGDRIKLKPGDRLSYRVLEDKEEPRSLTVSPAGQIDLPLIGLVEVQQQSCKEAALKIQTLLEKKYYQRATVILVILEASALPVTLPAAKEKIYIYGQVRSPGSQDGGDGQLTLSRAILNAGGFSPFANSRKVKVFQKKTRDEKGQALIVDVDAILNEGRFEKDILLEPGDYVLVPEKMIRLF